MEGQPGFCAKIYAAKAVNARLHDKLRAMVADPPKDPTVATKNHHSIAWPTQLLYRGPADPLYFAGFVMPAIAGQDFKKAICRFHPGDRRKEFGGDFTWLYAYTAAMNIASAVAAIHERGYCIGDINESNILVAGNTMSTLIDCDSFQVREAKTGRVFRCVVGKGEYTAPELGGKHYADVDRTAATDHFGLAVLMFQFLMEGCHPYQARGPLVEDAPTTEKKISLGHFPYRHAGKRQGVEPPAYAPPFDILHPELQGLFVRAFVDGHKDPVARPTSLEWYKSLGRLRDQIIECKAHQNHRYFSQFGACPWCRLRHDKGKDPFPEPGSRAAKKPAARTVAPPPGRPVLKIKKDAFLYRYRLLAGVAVGVVLAAAVWEARRPPVPHSAVHGQAYPQKAPEPPPPVAVAEVVRPVQAKAEDVEAERLRQAQVAAFVAEARRLLAKQKYVAAVNELKKANALGGSPEADALLASIAAGLPGEAQAEPARVSRGHAEIKWIRIPGGSFMMGSRSGESDEKPVHRVTIKIFQMAKTEVTNKQYRVCVEAGACTAASDIGDKFNGNDQPVVGVDWNQAKAFSEWVGGRLPSEAEWEYAARSGGKEQKYPWGDEEATCERAVMSDGGGGCGRGSTWPVCSKPAGNTQQGLCDMAGNVLEWVQDWYHDSYNGAPTDGSAWGNPVGSYRVVRGGSWDFVGARRFRAGDRFNFVPGVRDFGLGLRPVRSSSR